MARANTEVAPTINIGRTRRLPLQLTLGEHRGCPYNYNYSFLPKIKTAKNLYPHATKSANHAVVDS